MGQSVVYSHPYGISKSSISSGSGGGDVEDILKRLGNVEASVADLRVQVGVIVGTIPHLATAASVGELRKEVGALAAVIPHLATVASVAELGSKMSAMETRIIKWLLSTTLTAVAVAFTIAKFVH